MELTYSPVQPKLQESDPFNPFAEEATNIEATLSNTPTENESPLPSTIQEISAKDTFQLQNLFPKSLEKDGYVILSGVILIGSACFLLLIVRITRAIKQMSLTTSTLKDMTLSLYINQQSMEYKLLLDELNSATNEITRYNIQIQIYNLMNQISREICETKDLKLAQALGTAFFSKILGRFQKIDETLNGVIYFKIVGESLVKHSQKIAHTDLLHAVRLDYTTLVNPKKQKKIKKSKKK